MFHYLIIFCFASLQFLAQNAAEWSPWNHWSVCFEHSLGISAQTRTRACLGDAGNKCQGSDTQAKACLPQELSIKRDEHYIPSPPSSPVPSVIRAEAKWTPWSEWTECQSLPMGSSRPFRTRWRICDRRKCEMGESTKTECIPCKGTPTEQMNCVEPAPQTLSKQREQCQWNEWSAWSPCSTTCGPGTRVRVRGCPCHKCSPEGPSHEEQICYNLLPCPYAAQPTLPVALSTMAFTNVSLNPATVQPFFDPCSLCPADYPLPCYTCLNLHTNG
uniref:Thrombospondin type 1 domain protein n=1 Tax=Globodera pallida TaxID=36090 RepID=A0A183BY11_GLOPA